MTMELSEEVGKATEDVNSYELIKKIRLFLQPESRSQSRDKIDVYFVAYKK